MSKLLCQVFYELSLINHCFSVSNRFGCVSEMKYCRLPSIMNLLLHVPT